MPTLTIPARFTGPPDSANGGVTCGLLAQATGLDEITLRLPPPLGRPLSLVDGSLYDGDALVASAAVGAVEVVPPAPVSVKAAALATASYGGWSAHPFPTCFVCGPDKQDGLRVFPGRVAEGVVAAPWVPHDDGPVMDPVMVWAALDCPSGWSFDIVGRPMVLGRMTCRIDALPVAGEDHVLMGWQIGREGRKGFTGSALFTASGTLLARAQHTWIALSP
ncbi:MAG TPA: hypothetical protein VM097_09330 [Mycobacteriales bacterium]|nr:hypothetical protein [Mycobacteriales bacterium]